MRLLVCLGAGLIIAGAMKSSGPKRLSAFDRQARELLARMTIDEKIGQMTQADKEFIKDPTVIKTLFLGSVLNGGSSDPDNGNSLEAWTDMVDNFQKQAMETRLRIPLLYGVDSVHGHSNVLGAVIFPHNVGLGCTRNSALIEKIMRITAEETRATGINWAFAPCVTVPQDARWGRTPRIRPLFGTLPVPRFWVCKETLSMTRWGCSRAPSIMSAMAALHGGQRARARAWTKAIPASMKPLCAASICRATIPRLPPASGRSCHPTAVGTA